jgi:rhamnose transport system permease protein
MALSSLAMGLAMKSGAGLPLMVLAAFATGALAGALNGWLVTCYRLPSIVVTIGTLSLYRGIALVALGDQAITGYPEPLSVLGNGYLGDLIGAPWLIVPLEFVVFLLMAAAVGTLLHRTVVGRRVYAIGANPIASRFSGIEVDRYRFWLFVFAGVAAALAAVMLTGRIGSTRPNIALGWELDAVTMVILGGVAIEGGRGSIVGTVLAALLMGMFTFALGMVNVSGIVMSMLIGVLLVVAMVLPGLASQGGGGRVPQQVPDGASRLSHAAAPGAGGRVQAPARRAVARAGRAAARVGCARLQHTFSMKKAWRSSPCCAAPRATAWACAATAPGDAALVGAHGRPDGDRAFARAAGDATAADVPSAVTSPP